MTDRIRPAAERDGLTRHFTLIDHTVPSLVGGAVPEVDCYVTVGLDDAGRVIEVFVKLSRTGSSASGFAEATAQMASLALQHGMPLAKLYEKWRGTRFEPSGRVSFEEAINSPPGITRNTVAVTSPLDAVAQWLQRRFPDQIDA